MKYLEHFNLKDTNKVFISGKYDGVHPCISTNTFELFPAYVPEIMVTQDRDGSPINIEDQRGFALTQIKSLMDNMTRFRDTVKMVIVHTDLNIEELFQLSIFKQMHDLADRTGVDICLEYSYGNVEDRQHNEIYLRHHHSVGLQPVTGMCIRFCDDHDDIEMALNLYRYKWIKYIRVSEKLLNKYEETYGEEKLTKVLNRILHVEHFKLIIDEE